MTIPQKQSTTKAFVYLRVSGMAQLDGDGFERQLITCQHYADSHDIEIVEVFREEGVSGTTEIDGRKALPAMLAALEANGVKIVLIEKLDRLARDLLIQETILLDMQKHGYTLISALEPDLCLTDPSRVLMRHIFGAIAQYDKTMIVLKLNAGRQRMRDRGERCEGRKPYGDRPGESDTLQMMRELRAKGTTFAQIAEALNGAGTTARSGGPWFAQTVHKILARQLGG